MESPPPPTEPKRLSLVDRLPERDEPWYPAFDDHFRNFTDLFDQGSRSQRTVEQARTYGLGLLSTEGRKSMEPIAERTATPYHRTQYFITGAVWSPEAVQLRHTAILAKMFATEDGVFSLDDEGDPKKGNDSAGVTRQYCGNRGKEENCQVGVCLSYIRPHPSRYADMVSFGMAMRLYLNEARAADMDHRERTHIPDEVEYEPKWQIGLDQIDRVLPLKVPHQAVVADADYGRVADFRRGLRERKEAYVLGVQPSQTQILLEGEKEPRTCAEVARTLPESAWRKLTWSKGTKGDLVMEMARVRATVSEKGHPTTEEDWVLFERRTNETKAYLAWGLDGLSLRAQVRLVRARWGIELWFEHAKSELGLDQFEGRSWPGWHHNVSMVMLDHGYLMIQRTKGKGKDGKPLPTLPAVKRATEHRVVAELMDRVIADEDKGRREKLAITALEVMGRPPKLTADGHLFVSKDWRDYLDAG